MNLGKWLLLETQLLHIEVGVHGFQFNGDSEGLSKMLFVNLNTHLALCRCSVSLVCEG